MYAREPEPPREILIEVAIDWTHERILEEVETVSKEYGVSTSTLNAVINCESNYVIDARGDSGFSRGLVQIHSGYHDITDEQADDPKFAIRFLAEHIKEGNGNLWTCYRNLI